jgi:hypothetical protein
MSPASVHSKVGTSPMKTKKTKKSLESVEVKPSVELKLAKKAAPKPSRLTIHAEPKLESIGDKKTTNAARTPATKAASPKSARAAAAAESLTKLGQKWASLFKKFNDSAVPYNVSGTYEAKTPILHKVLGWGYVLANKNDRLEVLFQDGIKYLISNYKRD